MAMESRLKAHISCFNNPPTGLRQTTICLGPRLQYTFPPKESQRRTPAPNVVKRTTHVPFFSTGDRSRTSFLRFPPEIRLEIYRRLLLSDHEINYLICLVTSRFIAQRQYYQSSKYPYIRHGLFPAILECCRLINEEGTPLLYGENRFVTACCGRSADSSRPVVNSWPLARRNLECITTLDIGVWTNPASNLAGLTVGEQCAMFPALKSVQLEMRMLASKWATFLDNESEKLGRIPNVEIELEVVRGDISRVWESAERVLKDGYWVAQNAEEFCYRLYRPAMEKHSASWKGKTPNWSFRDNSDDYGANWSVKVILGKGNK